MPKFLPSPILRVRGALCARIAILLLLAALTQWHPAARANSQTYSQVNCVSGGGGGADWTTPELAEASNNVYASAVVDGSDTDPLRCTSYGFRIPASATINGIEVRIERKSSSAANGGSNDEVVRLVKGGVLVGNDLATATVYTTADVTEVHGGPANLWGTTWTPAEINAANFGVEYVGTKNNAAGGAHTITVDEIQITIYYTTSAGAATQSQLQVTCATQGGAGTAWTNGGRADSSSDTYATVSLDGSNSELLRCTSYGFTIPAAATVLGFEVNIERRSSSTANGGSDDLTVQMVKAGAGVGSNLATNTVYPLADTLETHGGPTNLWGTTWTPAEVNAANFGVQYAATKASGTGGAHTISLDHLQITVYYNVPPPAPALISPANATTSPVGLFAFDWGDVIDDDFDTVTYDIQVDNSGCAFPSAEINQTALATSTYTPGVGLADGTYCWRARAVDSNGTAGAWSATSGFTVSKATAFHAVQPGAAVSTPITTKIAGTMFSLDILAVRAGAIHTIHTGTASVEIVDATTGGGVCASMTALQTLTPITFVGGDNGRKAVTTFLYANSAPNARIRVSDSALGVTSCLADNFAIRPSTLALFTVQDNDWQTATPLTRTLNNKDLANLTLVHKAGRPFSLSAIARNSAGATTTNYTGTVDPVQTVCSGANSGGCTATFPIGGFAIGTPVAVAGIVSSSTATYSDVGSFDLQLQDTTFAAIDASDSTTAERYITSGVITVGRFVPDRFVLFSPDLTARADIAGCQLETTGSITAATNLLTVASAAGFGNNNVIVVQGAGTAGADLVTSISSIAGNVFTLAAPAQTTVGPTAVYRLATTYHGGPFGLGYTISALNASSAVTARYTGALAKGVVTLQAENNDAGTDLNNSGTRITGGLGSWSSGNYAVNTNAAIFTRTASPDGPYDGLQLGVAVADPDGPAPGPVLSGRNMNAATSGACAANCTAVAVGTLRERFGRLTLSNANGSELLNLPVASEVQYWNGTRFVVNTEDSCTTIDDANIDIVYTPNTCSSPVVADVTYAAGVGNLRLTAPGVFCRADLTADLAAESKTYLQGRWSGTLFNQNPSSRATFGVRGSGPVIFRRENYGP